MTEVVVLEVPSEHDLKPFSRYLWQQGVSHRILENNGKQLLLVGNQQLAIQVREAYRKMLTGQGSAPQIELPEATRHHMKIATLLAKLPVTLGLVVLSILGFAIVYFDRDFGWVKYLSFFDFELAHSGIKYSLPEGQYWRLLTPIFLHFSLMHIAFNMALLWFAGQRIEFLQGSGKMFALCILIGLGSNIMQARFAEAAIFGGMSGVVYGLLGYGWVWSLLRPDKSLHIPNALLYFSLFMMVMGFAGLASLLGAGKIANLAHLGGLVIGCLIGLGAATIDKLSSQ